MHLNVRFSHGRRGRLGIALLATGGFAAVAGTAVAMDASAGTSAPDPALRPAPISATVNPVVASQFSALRRAPTSSDVMPTGFQRALQGQFPQVGSNVAQARRVRASDGQAAYLVPANGSACVINTNEAFCAPPAIVSGGAALALDLCSPSLPKGQIEMEWLLPDGADNVAVRLANGARNVLPSGVNVYITRFAINGSLPKTIEWNASGQHAAVTGIPSDVKSMKCAHPGDLPLPQHPPSGRRSTSAAPTFQGTIPSRGAR